LLLSPIGYACFNCPSVQALTYTSPIVVCTNSNILNLYNTYQGQAIGAKAQAIYDGWSWKSQKLLDTVTVVELESKIWVLVPHTALACGTNELYNAIMVFSLIAPNHSGADVKNFR